MKKGGATAAPPFLLCDRLDMVEATVPQMITPWSLAKVFSLSRRLWSAPV